MREKAFMFVLLYLSVIVLFAAPVKANFIDLSVVHIGGMMTMSCKGTSSRLVAGESSLEFTIGNNDQDYFDIESSPTCYLDPQNSVTIPCSASKSGTVITVPVNAQLAAMTSGFAVSWAAVNVKRISEAVPFRFLISYSSTQIAMGVFPIPSQSQLHDPALSWDARSSTLKLTYSKAEGFLGTTSFLVQTSLPDEVGVSACQCSLPGSSCTFQDGRNFVLTVPNSASVVNTDSPSEFMISVTRSQRIRNYYTAEVNWDNRFEKQGVFLFTVMNPDAEIRGQKFTYSLQQGLVVSWEATAFIPAGPVTFTIVFSRPVHDIFRLGSNCADNVTCDSDNKTVTLSISNMQQIKSVSFGLERIGPAVADVQAQLFLWPGFYAAPLLTTVERNPTLQGFQTSLTENTRQRTVSTTLFFSSASMLGSTGTLEFRVSFLSSMNTDRLLVDQASCAFGATCTAGSEASKEVVVLFDLSSASMFGGATEVKFPVKGPRLDMMHVQIRCPSLVGNPVVGSVELPAMNLVLTSSFSVPDLLSFSVDFLSIDGKDDTDEIPLLICFTKAGSLTYVSDIADYFDPISHTCTSSSRITVPCTVAPSTPGCFSVSIALGSLRTAFASNQDIVIPLGRTRVLRFDTEVFIEVPAVTYFDSSISPVKGHSSHFVFRPDMSFDSLSRAITVVYAESFCGAGEACTFALTFASSDVSTLGLYLATCTAMGSDSLACQVASDVSSAIVTISIDAGSTGFIVYLPKQFTPKSVATLSSASEWIEPIVLSVAVNGVSFASEDAVVVNSRIPGLATYSSISLHFNVPAAFAGAVSSISIEAVDDTAFAFTQCVAQTGNQPYFYPQNPEGTSSTNTMPLVVQFTNAFMIEADTPLFVSLFCRPQNDRAASGRFRFTLLTTKQGSEDTNVIRVVAAAESTIFEFGLGERALVSSSSLSADFIPLLSLSDPIKVDDNLFAFQRTTNNENLPVFIALNSAMILVKRLLTGGKLTSTIPTGTIAHPGAYWCGGLNQACKSAFPGCAIEYLHAPQCYGADGVVYAQMRDKWVCEFDKPLPLPAFDDCIIDASVTLTSVSASLSGSEMTVRQSYNTEKTDFDSDITTTITFPEHVTATVPDCNSSEPEEWCTSDGGHVISLRIATTPSENSVSKVISIASSTAQSAAWSMNWTTTHVVSGVSHSGTITTPVSTSITATGALASTVLREGSSFIDIFVSLPNLESLAFAGVALYRIHPLFDSVTATAGVSCGAFVTTADHNSWPFMLSERQPSSQQGADVEVTANVTLSQMKSFLLRCSVPSAVSEPPSLTSVVLSSRTFGPIATVSFDNNLPASLGINVERLFFSTRTFDGTIDFNAIQNALDGDSSEVRIVHDGSTASTDFSSTASIGVRFMNGSAALQAYARSIFWPLLEAASGAAWETTTISYSGFAGWFAFPDGSGGYRTDCGAYDDAVCLVPNDEGLVSPSAASSPCFGETRISTDSGCRPKFGNASVAFTKHDDALSLVDITLSVDVDPESRFVMPQRYYMARLAMPFPIVVSMQQGSTKCVQEDTDTPITCYAAPIGDGVYGFVYVLSPAILQSPRVVIRHTFSVSLEIRDTVVASLDVVDNANPAQSYLSGAPATGVLDYPINYKDISGDTSLAIFQAGAIAVSVKFAVALAVDMSSLSFSLLGADDAPLSTSCTVVRLSSSASQGIAAQTILTEAVCDADTGKCTAGPDDSDFTGQTLALFVCEGTLPAGASLSVNIYTGFSRLFAGKLVVPEAVASKEAHCHRSELLYTTSQAGLVTSPSVSTALLSGISALFDRIVSNAANDIFFHVDDSAMALRVCTSSAMSSNENHAPKPSVTRGLATYWLLSAAFSDTTATMMQSIVRTASENAVLSVAPSESNGYFSLPATEVDLKCTASNDDLPSRSVCALKQCSSELDTPIFCFYGTVIVANASECRGLREWPSPPVHGCDFSAIDIPFFARVDGNDVVLDFRIVPKDRDALAMASELSVSFSTRHPGNVPSLSVVEARYISLDGQNEGDFAIVNTDVLQESVAFTIASNFDARYRIRLSSLDANSAAAIMQFITTASRDLKDNTGSILFNSSTSFSSSAFTAQHIGGDAYYSTLPAFGGLENSHVHLITPPSAFDECFVEIASDDSVSRSIFVSNWSADGAHVARNTDGGADHFLFTQIPASPLSTSTRVRCTQSSASTTQPHIVVSALSTQDGLLYRSHTVSPQRVADLSHSVSYFRVSENGDVSAGDVDAIVPSWLKEVVTVVALSDDEGNRTVVLRMPKGVQMYLLSPIEIDTAMRASAFLSIVVPAPHTIDTVDIDTILQNMSPGSWMCESSTAGMFTLTCAVANNCGSSYSSDLACVSAGTPFDPESISAKIACLDAHPPTQLPVWTGCGTFMCRNPAGDLVECDDSSVCVQGCAANVPITKALTDAGAPLSSVCAKSGVAVPSSLCPVEGVSAPHYAEACNATTTCGPVCTDSSGSVAKCDSASSWSVCSTNCGNGTQTLSFQCGDTSVTSGAPAPAIAPQDLCGWGDASALPFTTERACTDMTCAGADWACVPSDNPSAAPAPCTQNTFSQCPTKGCSHPTISRFAKCYFDGSLLVDDAHCSTAKPAETHPCPVVTEGCLGEWRCRALDGAWGDCQSDSGNFGFTGACSNDCGSGERFRSVGCALIIDGIVSDDASLVQLQPCLDGGSAQPADTQPCVDNTCPPGQWSCSHGDDSTASDCEETSTSFPACPTDGCYVPSVSRIVECRRNGATIGDERCAGDKKPSERFTCSPALSSCNVHFPNDTCYDHTGEVSMCHVPGQPAAKRHGSCVDGAGVDVPNEWCSAEQLQEQCSLPDCPTEARWHVTVADECYTGPEATCRSFLPIVSMQCEVRLLDEPEAPWTIVSDEYCSNIPEPLNDRPCNTSPSCSNGGSCTDSPAPAGAVPGSTGVCNCPLGTSGTFCDNLSLGIEVRASVDKNGMILIEWSVPFDYIAYNALVSLILLKNETREMGLVINMGIVPAADKALTVSAATSGILPGEYTAAVSVTGLPMGESSILSLHAACSYAGNECGEWGSCNEQTGKCSCVGGWSGSACSISPCNDEACYPLGGVCTSDSHGFSECECMSDESGSPLFTGESCHTPVNCTIDGTVPECLNGGIRGGLINDDGIFECGSCACKASWSGDQCNQCSLQCYNGGFASPSCETCFCPLKGGYGGEGCTCREMYMSFVVLRNDLPFPLDNRVSAERKFELLRLFASSFAFDLRRTTNAITVVSDGNFTESVSKTGVEYISFHFHVKPNCEPNAAGPVPDSHMLLIYNGISDVKSLLSQMHALDVPQTFDTLPNLFLLHAPSGFSATDPNCKLGALCPSGYRNNGVFPGESGSAGEGEEDTDEPSQEESKQLSTGAIVGIAVGASVLLILLCALLFCWLFGLLCFASAPKVASSKETEMMAV